MNAGTGGRTSASASAARLADARVGAGSEIWARPVGAWVPRGRVIACALLWMVLGLFGHEPYKPDEAYTIGLVKGVLDSGDWVMPRLAGEPFMEKPPLFFVTAALMARLLPVLPMHEAARLAVVLYVALALSAIAGTARALHGEGSGRIAVLLTLATWGTLPRLHQVITDTALFAGMSVALYGLAETTRRPVRAGAALGCGTALAFLSKGLLGPGLIALTACALVVALPAWRTPGRRRALAVAVGVALPIMLMWAGLLAQRAPAEFRAWLFDNNLGRFLDWNDLGPKKDHGLYLRLLWWYAFPVWPLALYGWWQARHRIRSGSAADPVLLPLTCTLVGLAVLTAASDGRELYAMVLLPALAVAAVDGCSRISPRVERWLSTALSALLAGTAAALVAVWLAAMNDASLPSRFPAPIRLPGMVPAAPAAIVTFAAGAVVLVAAMVATRRARGTFAFNAAAGAALVWASLLLPWGACLDALKGYRGLATALQQHLDRGACVASLGLGEGERGLLDYYLDLRTQRLEVRPSTDCSSLIVQARPGVTDSIGDGWTLRWVGSRAGSDTSTFRLYSRRP